MPVKARFKETRASKSSRSSSRVMKRTQRKVRAKRWRQVEKKRWGSSEIGKSLEQQQN